MSGNPERPMKIHVDSFVKIAILRIEFSTEIRIMIDLLIQKSLIVFGELLKILVCIHFFSTFWQL